MLELDVEQGSAAWVEARLGIPTASEFSRIVTPAGKVSASQEPYMCELLAEYFTGEPLVDFSSEWTERGKVLEPDAFDEYAFQRDMEPRKVGLCYRNEAKMVACSPDGLTDPDGGWEVKSPGPGKHLLYLAGDGVPRAHVPQVQGCIWVTQREWWDFMSYHPDFPSLIVRMEPDEKYQAALDKQIPLFVEQLLEKRAKLQARGVIPWRDAA